MILTILLNIIHHRRYRVYCLQNYSIFQYSTIPQRRRYSFHVRSQVSTRRYSFARGIRCVSLNDVVGARSSARRRHVRPGNRHDNSPAVLGARLRTQ